MRHKLLVLACIAILASLPLTAKSSGRSSGHSSQHSSSKKSSKSDSGKTQHVDGYTRKNGTYVAPYDRHPAGTAPRETTSFGSSHSIPAPTLTYTPYTKDHLASGYTPHSSVTYDKHGKIKRSESAKNAFKREYPCPGNGNTSGKCPGYVIDHVKPLECGGADAPSNMQWQTAADGKAKDKTEHYSR